MSDPSLIGGGADGSNLFVFISLIIAVVTAAGGTFAYLSGQLQRVSAGGKRELETFREETSRKFDGIIQSSIMDRQEMRREFSDAIRTIQSDVRNIMDNGVRRQDMENMESRIVRTQERLEGNLANRINEVIQMRLGRAQQLRDDI